MKQLDYRPNAIAQSLASSRSNSIGVLLPELHDPFYSAMMSGSQTGISRVLEFTLSLVYEGDNLEIGDSQGFKALMKAEQSFTALICANEEMAAGAMDAARQFNVDIPSQIYIVGFDNISLANYIYPKLSTIDYPLTEMGHMAARWILRNTYKNKSLSIENMFHLFIHSSLSKSTSKTKQNTHKTNMRQISTIQKIYFSLFIISILSHMT